MIEVTKQKAKALFKTGLIIYLIPSSIPLELANLSIQLDRRYHLDFDYHLNKIKENHSLVNDPFLFYVKPLQVKVASFQGGYNVITCGGCKLNPRPIHSDKGLVKFMNSRLLQPVFPGALVPSVRNFLIAA
jgi:hypothetical protein